MKLTINLATRRYINMRQVNAFLLACFLILGVLLVLKVREVAYNHAELKRIRGLTAAAGSGSGAAAVSEEQLKELTEKIAFANSLIDKKSTNWLSLLDRLEEVVPAGVALTGIAPDPGSQQLNITGVARSFENVRALLENMEQSKNFSEVYLMSHGETKVGLTQRGVSFSVACRVSYR